jgi:hypothetical protein
MAWSNWAGVYRPVFSWHDEDTIWNDHWYISGLLACAIGAPAHPPPTESLNEIKRLEEEYRAAKKKLAKVRKELLTQARDLGLKGSGIQKFVENSTADLELSERRLRAAWLNALSKIAYSAELSLGKTLSVTNLEFNELANRVALTSSANNRLVADLVAAFGAETIDKDAIQPTEFCFISGSGQQFFLETIQKLLQVVTVDKIKNTLFDEWTYEDLRFSMRWDPQDDRRYALMWRDPTATGNETRTNWAANLFAYYGLSLFPSFIEKRKLSTTGFMRSSRVFSWPIWTTGISIDVARSILSDPALQRRPLNQSYLELRGISQIHESKRINVGTPPLVKTNFTQSRVV